jgi:large subunit ribosomal protein L24
MQTTLLGIAIALIVALLAALVGPHVIDWNAYRAQFEAEATRLTGTPVRVGGSLDVRLLPTPSLTVGKIEIGEKGERALRARAVGLEFALGPLLQGKLRANEMRVIGPEVTLVFDSNGRVTGQGLGFAPDTLAIEKLDVEDGRIALVDAASDRRLIAEKFWYSGDVRSLAGSFRGEGAFVTNGDLYSYRVSTSRQENNVKLRLSLDPAASPMPIEIDGTMTTGNGAPRFEGALSITRPAGTVLAGGRAAINEPYRLTARVNGRPASVLFEQIEFQYGPDERALKLTGTAELKLGAQPRLEGVAQARTLDIDKLIASTEQPRRTPFAAVKAFTESFGDVLRPSVPARIGIAVDTVTIGGAPVQSMRGDIKSDGEAWKFEGFEFRAPGLTQVRLSGQTQRAVSAPAFTGPVDVTSADPRALIAWLEGKSEIAAGAVRPMRGRGEVTLGASRVAIERFKAEIDRREIEGRLAYRFASSSGAARLDADLKADNLDLDALSDFSKAAFGATSLDRPKEVALSLDVGNARLAGVDIRKVRAVLSLDANALTIERLAVEDLGGASFSANGNIDFSRALPQGGMIVDIDARDLSGASALVARYAPGFAGSLAPAIERAGSAKLRAAFDAGPAADDKSRMAGKLAVEGHAGAVRVNLKADASGSASAPEQSEIKVEGALDAVDANALFRLLALDRAFAGSNQAGRLSFAANGPLQSGLRVESRIETPTLSARGAGNLKFSAAQGLDGRLDVTVAKADLAPLRMTAGQGGEPLPVRLSSRVAIARASANFEDLTGTIAGATIRGQLRATFGTPVTLDGKLEATSVDATALIASAIGMPPARGDERWSSEPFARNIMVNLGGQIELRTARAQLTTALATKDVKAMLRFAPSSLTLDNISAELGGGRLSGDVSFATAADGLSLKARMEMKDGDAAQLLPGDGNAVGGRIQMRIAVEGSGLSPKALVGSLSGTGNVTLDRGRFGSLDPKVFPTAMRAADRELPPDLVRLRMFVQNGLDAGRLDVPIAESAIAIAGGQVRLSKVNVRAIGADVTLSGAFDLNTNSYEARLVFVGSNVINAAGPPEIGILLKGTPSAAMRTLDVSALMSWLTLRSVEQQARKIEAIEAARAAEPPPPESVPMPPSPPSAVPDRVEPLPPPIQVTPAPGARSQRVVPAPRPGYSPSPGSTLQ